MKRIIIIACALCVAAMLACSDDAEKKKSRESDLKVQAFLYTILKSWEMKTVEDVPTFSHPSGLAPSCSNCPGSNPDFAFFVRRGDPTKLMVFFMGGGACWNITNCVYNPTYSQDLFESAMLLSLVSSGMGKERGVGGLLDKTNHDNPFRDWTIVYVPYCTGDLNAGQADHEYTDTYNTVDPIGPVTIRHRGAVNTALVVQWMTENIDKTGVTNLFVTGLSAGSYAAVMNYSTIREAFPNGTACLLGDAGVGFTGVDDAGNRFTDLAADRWNIDLPDTVFGTDVITDYDEYRDLFYEIVNYYSADRFTQYTTMYDATQTWFYNIQVGDHIEYPNYWGSETGAVPDLTAYKAWSDGMYAGTGGAIKLHDPVPSNYAYYIGAGTDHTIIFYNKTYTEASVSGGTSFVDWVDSLVNGTAMPPSEVCTVCDAPF